MDDLDRLRHLIDVEADRLAAAAREVSDREAALVALIHAQDHLPITNHGTPIPDLISGHRLSNVGVSRALQLCLENADDGGHPSRENLEDWADSFLRSTRGLEEARLILAHCETGFFRLASDGDDRFTAWTATKRIPTPWRERADFDWWASFEKPIDRSPEPERRTQTYRSLAHAHLGTLACQFSYPPDAVFSGYSAHRYLDVLEVLIARALEARDRGEPVAVQSEAELTAEIAEELDLDPFDVGQIMVGCILDRDNVGYHAAVPGVATAPLVLIAPDRIVSSRYGLLHEPLLFLTRELRRRDAQAYHNVAQLRENHFRRDLYALFTDKRFVTSSGRIELRRSVGDVLTDIDAAIFDRKTGTLGIFELKSQDPFARSVAEMTRQRDNILYANRQMSGVLDWLKRYGNDELLKRIDQRIAKSLHVQKVVPFVLGRYLVHFNDGPAPDPRAAWGTWPQVLRLLAQRPKNASDANPIVSLSSALKNDPGPSIPLTNLPPHEIVFGSARLSIYSSFTAVQTQNVDVSTSTRS